MGALSSASPEVSKWVPEDDMLLKNAIEAGASLEALAKGAVNFTCRFSLKELQERWRALLYDSEVSAEASIRMIEYEASISSNPSIKQNGDPSPNPYKRTADSVRSRYYSMRKRVCTYQPAETAVAKELLQYDLETNDILPFLSDQSGGGPAFEPPPDYTDDLLMSPQICPNIEEREEMEMAESDGERKSGVEPNPQDPDPIWRSIQREEQQQAQSQAQQPPSNEIMNDIMEFQLEDLFFMDDNSIADASCSMYLSSPQDEVVNDTGGPGAALPVTESICADSNNAINKACNSVAVEALLQEDEVMVCTLNTEDWDIPDNDHLDFDDLLPNSNAHQSPNPDPGLNPNDSANKLNLDMAASSDMPLTDGRPTTGGLIGVKTMEPVTAVPIPVTVPSLIQVPANLEPLETAEPSILPQKVNLEPMVCPAASLLESSLRKVEASNVNTQNGTASNELNPAVNEVGAPQDMGDREIYEKPKEAEPDKPLQAANQIDYYSNPVSLPVGSNPGTGHQFDAPEKFEPSTQAALIVGAEERDIPGMVPDHSVGPGPALGVDLQTASASDHEEQQASDESDAEIPSYSDAEAVVLEMDLSPFDQDNNLLAKEVTRFHCAESRKTLIRLEQGARAYMNRAILSRGAFAVFYGQNLKYFIKSPEVSIGRETEDVKVDIDLGKEGRANKISRRQAIIRMDDSGSFHIKNIGKCSLFVNCKEVPANRRRNIYSGDLIESCWSFKTVDHLLFKIRGLLFMFEINKKAVNRYLFNMCRTGDYNHGNYEWIPVPKSLNGL